MPAGSLVTVPLPVLARVTLKVLVGVGVEVGVLLGVGVDVGVFGAVVSCNQPLTELGLLATTQLLTDSVLLPEAEAFCSITVIVPLPFMSTFDAVTTDVCP
jgi:hypothetical protein